MADYQFKYSPLTGRLTGNQMIEQTEQAINALASQVDSAAGQVEIISTLANEANENAATALEVANEALATTGRTYLTVSTQTDANNYYDSQLIYIADSTSTNIPVADTGMLEVKTNDNKTACEQVFIADSSGDAYYRNGAITAETVGDVTTYSVTWGGWSSQPASQTYVQGELANYLPLSGGTVTGGLTVEGNITGNLVGNADTATNATNDANGDPIASTYLPLAGGTMLGSIAWGQGEIGYRATTHTAPYDPCKQMIVTAGTVDSEWNDGNAKLALHTYDSTGTNTAENGAFVLQASDGTNAPYLEGKPNGELTWNSNNVLTDGTTGNIISKTGTSSTTNTYVNLAEINQHDAGVWLIIGHIDCSTSFNNIYNNLLAYPNSPSNPARCSGQGGGGCYSVAVSYLAANAVVDLRGFIPSGVSTTMRGRLTMVRLA